ncbi:thioredoxin family protein [Alteribacter aurantiacus]|uniref:thioredoxin family protein n=1 Tax=Alteribacter aurantiacus TaxID=254410 RepID=UPI0004254879|nr:thioredoxin family protein [Alteribacter aurantiacus]
MKKIIIFGVAIVIIFGALAFVTSYQNQKQSEGNPYGVDSLPPETIDTLDNPMYENIILPEELEEKMDNGEDFTVYFFSPACPACSRVSPEIIPMAEEKDVDLHLFNVQVFEEGFDRYIDATPTVIHYENGEVAYTIEGAADRETYERFYDEVVLGEE